MRTPLPSRGSRGGGGPALSFVDRLQQAARLARERAGEVARNNPAVRKRVEVAKAVYEDLRVAAEARVDRFESEMWAWIARMQEEAQKAQRQSLRAQSAADHFRTLGLPPGSTMDEVKKAWRNRMRECHPDRFAGDKEAEARAHEEAQRVNMAYAELTALLTGREDRAS